MTHVDEVSRLHLLHPLFVFNQFGDVERCALRPGNVHSADNWEAVLKPVVDRYNQRATAEQHIKEGKGAIKWTRLSCRTFVANASCLQLHALAYNLVNFLPTLVTPAAIEHWTLTSLREKLIKIGAKVAKSRALRQVPGG